MWKTTWTWNVLNLPDIPSEIPSDLEDLIEEIESYFSIDLEVRRNNIGIGGKLISLCRQIEQLEKTQCATLYRGYVIFRLHGGWTTETERIRFMQALVAGTKHSKMIQRFLHFAIPREVDGLVAVAVGYADKKQFPTKYSKKSSREVFERLGRDVTRIPTPILCALAELVKAEDQKK